MSLSTYAPPAAVVALDVARAVDFSALVAVGADGAVLFLDRWQPRPTWTDAIEKTCRLAQHPALLGPPVIVDASAEGGRHVAALLARNLPAGTALYAAVSTSSPKPPKQLRDGRILVSKRDLVGGLVDAVTSGRLRVPAALPSAAILVRELQAFTRKTTDTGAVVFEAARASDHDDTVDAVALALWLHRVLRHRQGIGGLFPLRRTT